MSTVSWIRIVFDITVLIVLTILSQVIFKSVITPFHRGFYCNDYSVNLPYNSSTVPNSVLAVLSLVVPFVVILGTEIARFIFTKVKSKNETTQKNINYYLNLFCFGKRKLPEQIGNFYVIFGLFLFGLLSTNCLTNLSKLTIGRLRPNFLDICRPDTNPYTNVCNISGGKNYVVPGVDFKCTNPDIKEVNGARKSFPSGHSSLTFYTMVFLALFIQKTWNCRHIGLFKHFLQTTFIGVALYTAQSRVSDNKHHPGDVVAGSVLGVIIAVVTYGVLYRFLNRKDYKVSYQAVEQYELEINERNATTTTICI